MDFIINGILIEAEAERNTGMALALIKYVEIEKSDRDNGGEDNHGKL